MKEGKTSEIQSVLIIHQGALGDFILALPTLANLRKAFPNANTVIMGYPRILELVEQRFYAEKIFSIDQKGMASFFIQEGPLDGNLARFFRNFDLIVVFCKDGEGNLIKNLRRVCQGKIFHLNPFPIPDEGIHLTDHLLGQLANYGLPISEFTPRLHLKESDRGWGIDFWKGKGLTKEERSKVIIIHPGSGSKKKIWPFKQFLDLIQYLRGHFDSKILIILGPAEGSEIRKAFEELRSTLFILGKELPLLQLASVIEGCQLFIGNDSGISHMAASLGLPTVAIFGPTDHRIWSPRGEKTVVVRSEVPCSPCSEERFFLCKDFECLSRIGIGEVLQGIKNIGIDV